MDCFALGMGHFPHPFGNWSVGAGGFSSLSGVQSALGVVPAIRALAVVHPPSIDFFFIQFTIHTTAVLGTEMLRICCSSSLDAIGPDGNRHIAEAKGGEKRKKN